METIGSQFGVQTEEIQKPALFGRVLGFPKIERHSREFEQADALLGVGTVCGGVPIQLGADVSRLLAKLVCLGFVLFDVETALKAVLVDEVELALEVGDLLGEAAGRCFLEAPLLGVRLAQRRLEEVEHQAVDPEPSQVLRVHPGQLLLAVEARLPAGALASSAVVVDVLLLLDLADEQARLVELGAHPAVDQPIEGELVALHGWMGGPATRHDVLNSAPRFGGDQRRMRRRVPAFIPEELGLVERILQQVVDRGDAKRCPALRARPGRRSRDLHILQRVEPRRVLLVHALRR